MPTSVELHLKIELPLAVTNIAGNAEEGCQIIVNKQQISDYHRCEVKIDIADAKYDIITNYEYIRGSGSIPIINYNPRNKKLSKRPPAHNFLYPFDIAALPKHELKLICRFRKDR
jgi:hypothetical protein